jgi:hypothetical protein
MLDGGFTGMLQLSRPAASLPDAPFPVKGASVRLLPSPA